MPDLIRNEYSNTKSNDTYRIVRQFLESGNLIGRVGYRIFFLLFPGIRPQHPLSSLFLVIHINNNNNSNSIDTFKTVLSSTHTKLQTHKTRTLYGEQIHTNTSTHNKRPDIFCEKL
jgi:hypothetical protein